MSTLRADLEGLRDILRASLDAADADKRAGLAREYRATLIQLAELPAEAGEKEATGLDEFTAFAQQRAASKGSTEAKSV